jgi:hypothetical protein
MGALSSEIIWLIQMQGKGEGEKSKSEIIYLQNNWFFML